MNFASDNVYGVDDAILAAIGAANQTLTAPAYATDEWTKRAEVALNEVFECDVSVFLVASGTAANGLALSTMAQPFNAILCHADAHISVDECAAPEMFSGGAKLYGIDGAGNKLTAASVEAMLATFVRGEHNSKPAAVSITQATELGTVYTLDELTAITELAHGRGLKTHMDGARFANALVSLQCTPAEMTWKAGIDALSFGATKNGALGLEAVIFFDAALAEDFAYRRMRGGQLFSKGRYLGAQMEAYLKDDLWLDNARRANAHAGRLAAGLAEVPGIRVPLGADANLVFPILPRTLHDELKAAGAVYHLWPGAGPVIDTVGEDEVFARLVTSFATRDEDVDVFIATARAAG
ncbi:MAG: low specificity L-threonine aldolase [Hyphomicrobiales bacterium]|nr:low specificity L-threonine aldolase [Hyphomicrobiales bacterium]